jgi:uncharacterized membrane protein YkgB
MINTIICEISTIICDIGIINVKFYLLEVRRITHFYILAFLYTNSRGKDTLYTLKNYKQKRCYWLTAGKHNKGTKAVQA